MTVTFQKAETAKATVSTTTADGSEDVMKESFPMKVEGDQVAKVTAHAGYTHNLGNYESMRVDASLEVPCGMEQIDEAFQFAMGWVDDKVVEIAKETKDKLENA